LRTQTTCFGVILAAFLVRLPSIVQPLGIDQGIFVACAWGLRRGLTLYREVWDQKPPGIHLIYALGFSVFGERASAVFVLDFLATVATCWVVGLVGREMGGRRAGWLAATLYAVGTIPAYAWRYGGFLERAVPETFAPLFIALAFLFLLRGRKTGRGSQRALAGACIALAALFKPTMVVYGVALAIWDLWPLGWRERTRALLNFTAGLAAPLLMVGAWLWLQGSVRDAWIAVVDYNRSYVSIGLDWNYPIEMARAIWMRMRSEPLWLFGAFGLCADLVTWLRTREHGLPLLRVLWATAAVLALAANGARMFNPYFMPFAVILAVAGGAFLDWLLADWRRRRLLIAATVAASALLLVRYGYFNRFWQATSADFARAFGSPDDAARLAYLERFGGYNTGRGFSARANLELGAYVSTHTAPDDRVYIFGMAPEVYFSGGRRPANRFIWSSPVVFKLFDHPDFSLERLTGDVGRAGPELLVFERNTRDSQQGMNGDDAFDEPSMKALFANYQLETTIEDFLVFRRKR
jgi:hypothetical protein